jgi:hypothetical protein
VIWPPLTEPWWQASVVGATASILSRAASRCARDLQVD